jgi:uncharacterized GH25 family protein
MRRQIVLGLVLVAAAASLAAHDLFFRLDSYFVAPGARVVAPVLSGTFSRSENAIARDRLADLSLVSPAGARTRLDRASWTEREPRSDVSFTAGDAGTWVLGVSLQPRLLSLKGADFNAYLRDEGIDDVLARRKAAGRLDEPSRERYSKYVKALLQVGDEPSPSHATALGYDAEIVPLDNPYARHAGDTLRVQCLVKGRPLAAHAVFAGGRRAGGDARIAVQRLTTGEDGVVEVRLTDAGTWYVKFVQMDDVDEPEANYVSRWSTLSFAVR